MRSVPGRCVGVVEFVRAAGALTALDRGTTIERSPGIPLQWAQTLERR
jgi:hypothetical protein